MFLRLKTKYALNRQLFKICITNNLYFIINLYLKFVSWSKNIQSIELFSYMNLYFKNIFNISIFFLSQFQLYFIIVIFLQKQKNFLISVESLFFNFWWLERENSEMLGIFYEIKIDTRNLLLEYFNFFHPILHIFPSYGFFEYFFNHSRGLFMHYFNSLQL